MGLAEGQPGAAIRGGRGIPTFAGRTIDYDNLELRVNGAASDLPSWTDLLRYLVRHQGRSISRKELLEQVWRMREDTDTRAIDNFIVRLRRYIEIDPANPVFLRTVRGIGYRFDPQSKPAPATEDLHP